MSTVHAPRRRALVSLLSGSLLVASLVSFGLPAGASNDEDYYEGKHSLLGPGVRYSSDKPSFKAGNPNTKKVEKVKHATSFDPMAGGIFENVLGSGGGLGSERVSRRGVSDTTLLCPECQARAVLAACPNCKGQPFSNLCDKCIAMATLEACDKDKTKIREFRDKSSGQKTGL